MAATSKTKKDRHKRLLATGYFPEELTPAFTTVDLSRYRDSLLAQFNAIPNLKSGDSWFYAYRSSASPIYFPRFGKQDRKHFVLNPVSFFFLSKEISDRWVEIRKSLKTSKISASLPIFDWTEGRALLPNNFGERDRRTATLSVRNNFLLKSDLSRFYHSVYTHALAWAVHGKSIAKKNRSYALLGNRLDLLSRNGQDGQTIGVPVGPETSRILAELIGAAIDKDLIKESKLGSSDCMRFVDDFALGVSSREDAERALSLLRRIAHSYELEINEEKTSIESVYNLEYASWRYEIRQSRPAFGAVKSVFERYFDSLHAMSARRPGDNVLRYGIKVNRAIFVSATPWPSIEDFILLAYRKNPSVLPSVVEILVNRHQKKKDVNLAKVANFIGTNVRRLSETEKHGELAWLLCRRPGCGGPATLETA
jgi:Reverse transcriptase (RNA-dependent DNA polymerase)